DPLLGGGQHRLAFGIALLARVKFGAPLAQVEKHRALAVGDVGHGRGGDRRACRRWRRRMRRLVRLGGQPVPGVRGSRPGGSRRGRRACVGSGRAVGGRAWGGRAWGGRAWGGRAWGGRAWGRRGGGGRAGGGRQRGGGAWGGGA